MLISSLRDALCDVARQCSARGLQTGNGGNLSARVPGSEMMLVKASEVSFSRCGKEDFILTDFTGAVIEGEKKPSRECLLHGALYRVRPDCMSVVHCHSPWATGWASTLKNLPHATYHSAVKLGEEVRVFDTGSYIVPIDFFPVITDWLKAHPDSVAFLLRKHGQVALGNSLIDALYAAELVEETAHIAYIANSLSTSRETHNTDECTVL